MGIVLKNNAHTTLVADLNSLSTTVYVADTSSFPALGVGQYFYCTIESTSGTYEIVKVTQVNTSSFTVVRAQENTIAVPFSTGARVELRITVQALEDNFEAATTAAVNALIGTTIQAYDADLTTWAGLTPSANAQSLVTAADYAAMRTLLGLVIGTNVQAYDADLTTWAGLTPSANAQSLVTAADYAAMRTLLGLVIGTNVQAYDADLTTWASITPSANVQTLVSAANYTAIKTLLDLTGTNSGDQTITLTGDVTGSGTGSFAATITNNAVTVGKMAQLAAKSILANATNSTANVAALTGTANQFLQQNSAGTALGFVTMSGDATLTDGALTIAAGAVTYAKKSNMAGLSVAGRSASTTGVGADITGTANQFLQVNSGGTSLGFVTLSGDATLSSGALTIATGAVTLAKMANMATSSLIYRKTAGTGAPEVNTLATLKTDLGLTGTNSGDQTITLTGNVTGTGTGSFATTIASAAVTLANMANLSGPNVFIGRKTAGAGAPEEITLGADMLFTAGALNVGAYTGDITKSAASLATTVATTFVTGKTEDTTPDANADYVLSYDNSATAYKKVLHKNVKPTEAWIVAIGDETTALTTGTAKVTFRAPYAFTLTSVRASVNTVSSSGLPTFNVKEGGVTIFSTTLTIDASETSSQTAATAAVLSDTSLADDASITIDIDTAGTGAKGAKIVFIGYRT